MLTCRLDKSDAIPLYEQLYHYIKNEIIDGRLGYGTKLPSKRKLANFLKISINTVDAAYEQLVAEGYAESVPRKGYYVQASLELEFIARDTPPPDDAPEKVEWEYQFHPGRVDTEHFPFGKWRKYARNIIDPVHHRLLLVGDKQGEYALRKEIAHYLYHARGVTCTADEIIIGAGTEILLQQLFSLFDADAVFGVEDPGYHVVSHILKQHTNEVHPLDVDDDGLKVKQLTKTNTDIVYVTPSHHFPYGSVLSVNRRIQLLKWAQKSERRFIIEDDYDSEFRYSGKLIPSLQSMDQIGKVIYLGSFSKSFIPSLRISYMVLPKKLLAMYHSELSFYQCAVSRIDQHILAEFMAAGDFGRHLNRMRNVYARKLEVTITTLKPYEKYIRVIGAQSGLHVVLKVNNGLTEMELVEQAAAKGIEIYSLSRYAINPMPHNSTQIVLGFAGIPEAELESALHLLLISWGLKKAD